MLDLASIPFLSDLPAPGLARVRELSTTKHYAAGDVVVRMGSPGLEFHVIAAGSAWVDLEPDAQGRRRRVVLGPGQTLGEMAILSSLPVSATVTANADLTTYCLDSASFMKLLDGHPILYKRITGVLVDRLRHRTSTRPDTLRAHVALLLVPESLSGKLDVVRAIFAGVRHYALGSVLADALLATTVDSSTEPIANRVARWRDTAGGAQYLVVVVDADDPQDIEGCLEDGDVLLVLTDGKQAPAAMSLATDSQVAHRQVIHVGTEPAGSDPHRKWAFTLPPKEVVDVVHGVGSSPWDSTQRPVLDRIARYITCREVGVAMSVGAAAGLSHFGVLQCLERAGIPLDYLCGTSMGGIAALACARFGNALEASRQICEYGGSNDKIRDPAWLPRSALMAGRKGRRVADELFGAMSFADLGRPTAVVAADLVAGKRVILDTGSAAMAAQATSAIPGLFPPTFTGSQVLVDGGVVTRVPVDVLSRRRCGYRIAVTVVPDRAESAAERSSEARRLQSDIEKPWGFRSVIGMSWKLLGWWDSAVQAQQADHVISVRTPSRDSFNFDAAERMIDLGQRVGEDHLPGLHSAISKMLMPGMP